MISDASPSDPSKSLIDLETAVSVGRRVHFCPGAGDLDAGHLEIEDAARLAEPSRRSRLQTCHDLQVPVIPLRSARGHPYLSGTDGGRSSLCGKGMDRCVKSPHSFCPVTPNTQRIGRRRSVVRKPANGCCSASEPVWRLPLCQTRRKVNRK